MPAIDTDAAVAPTLPVAPRGEPGDELAAGTRAGEYVVEYPLGRGAMGEVYAGRHPLIDKRVAIKVLRHELAADVDAADRFLREARAAVQIDHPNVVHVFGFGRLDDGRLYLVMELVAGKPLRARLAAGAVAVDEALDILGQLAGALDCAHGRGVVHRDLKPDNIVMQSATAKVLDFGLAKLVARSQRDVIATLTARGSWLGTPAYMAPEQWSADGATAASDRYALGVIAFELLAGALPFDAANVPQMMEQHFRAAVPPLTARGGVTTRFDDVLARAMAKDPEARFATAQGMVDALRAVAGGARGEGRARRPYVAAAVAAGVLGAGIAVVASSRGGAGDGEPPTPATAPATAATPPPAVPHAHVSAEPATAHVLVDGRDLGVVPIDVDVAGTGVDVTIHAPGFADARRTAVAGGDVDVALAPIDGFAGVWRLPSGQLRALSREHAGGGDAVVVDKLDAVRGPRTFFRRYELVDAAGADLAFAATEETAVPAPGAPDCRVPLRVEYRYNVAGDTLELRRERVAVEVVEGRCSIRDKQPGDPERLVRVDRTEKPPTWVSPPAGGRVLDKPKPATSSRAAVQDVLDGKLDSRLDKLKDAPPTTSEHQAPQQQTVPPPAKR